MKYLCLAILCLLFTDNSFTQIAYYDDGDQFTSSSSSPDVSGSDASLINLNSGSTFNCGGPALTTTSWSIGSSIDLSEYIQYSITVNAGCTASFSGISFQSDKSGSGPANWEIRSSDDNYSSTLLSGIHENNCSMQSGSVAITAVSGTINFRIYGYNATASGGNVRIGDVSFNGAVTCTPTCDVTLETETYICLSNTSGDDNDAVTIEVSYSGSDATITSVITTSGGTVGGDNPASVPDGVITISGLMEGDSWDLTLNGGLCDGVMTSGAVPSEYCAPTSNGAVTIKSQFVNPCGGDGANEFIVAENSSTEDLNIADMSFGSAANNDNFNFWWYGSNVPDNPYDINGLSASPYENCGAGLECYEMAYPSLSSDASVITSRINELNNIAGCTVFLAVPSTDLIPAGAEFVIFLGAFNCGFDDAMNNLDFSNHCATSTQYYAVFGKGDGGGGSTAPCSNPSSGYFSNSAVRTSHFLVLNGQDEDEISSYDQNIQTYTPSPVASGNAGVAAPGANNEANWIGNSGCVPTPQQLLPVELLEFNLTKNVKTVDVTWSTASEINSDYFALEWSSDGINFHTIASVAGNGNTQSVKQYSWNHDSPVSGNNYYRLLQVDYDGSSTQYPINSIRIELLENEFHVYPTVVRSMININLPTSDVYQVDIINTKGSVQMTQRLMHNNQLDISNLPRGSYFITMRSNSHVLTDRFVKM